MQTVTLYFGSFNPIHAGHLAIVEYVARLDKTPVWLVVSPRNPLKTGLDDPGPEHRLTMTRLAVGTSPFAGQLIVCDFEFDLPRPSYTIDTLRALKERFPGHRFRLLLGSDLLEQLPRWKEYRRLIEEWPLTVYPRAGYPAGSWAEKVRLLEGAPQWECSSTQVRTCLAAGAMPSQWLAAPVARYIAKHHLYGYAR